MELMRKTNSKNTLLVYRLSKINPRKIGKKGVERILTNAFRHNFEIRNPEILRRKILNFLRLEVLKKRAVKNLAKVAEVLAQKGFTGKYHFALWKGWVDRTDELKQLKDKVSLSKA